MTKGTITVSTDANETILTDWSIPEFAPMKFPTLDLGPFPHENCVTGRNFNPLCVELLGERDSLVTVLEPIDEPHCVIYSGTLIQRQSRETGLRKIIIVEIENHRVKS